MTGRVSDAYGKLLAGLALAGCAILFAMMLLIVADVTLRNVAIPGLPQGLAWSLEWVGDTIGLGCCLFMAWYGTQAAWASYASGALNIKTLVTPEWWSLAPLPIVFVLLAIEMLFRMGRLQAGERGPRQDAVSAG